MDFWFLILMGIPVAILSFLLGLNSICQRREDYDIDYWLIIYCSMGSEFYLCWFFLTGENNDY